MNIAKSLNPKVQGLRKFAQKTALTAELTAMAVASMGSNVFASGLQIESVTVNPVDENTNILGNVIGLLIAVFQYVGIAMVIMGIVQFISAMHEDQPDKKTKALTFAICGAVLTMIRTILSQMGLIS